MQPLRVSASQRAAYVRCPRLWGHTYIDGIRPPSGPSAELGSETHTELEGAIKHGQVEPSWTKPTKAQRIAMHGWAHAVELHSKGAKAEQAFDFDYGGVIYHGFIDANYYDAAARAVKITDWKTSSDPAQWGLNAQSLAEDGQALIYSMYGLLQYPEAESVDLTWYYLRTRPPLGAAPVEVSLTREYVEQQFPKIHVDVERLKKARSMAVSDLPQNFAACGMYGGCYFTERCHGSAKPADRLKAVMAQSLRGGHLPRALLAKEKEGAAVSKKSLLDMMNEEENGVPEVSTSPITPEEEPFVEAQSSANEATSPPEEPPTEAGRAAMEKAYADAGQKLPPKKRGRPKGSKNKGKEVEPASEEGVPAWALTNTPNPLEQSNPFFGIDRTPAASSRDVVSPEPLAQLFDNAIEHCLRNAIGAITAADAREWAQAIDLLRDGQRVRW